MPQQLPPIGAEVLDLPPIGGEVTGLPAIGAEVRPPDFKTEVKASDTFSLGDVAGGWWETVNPWPMIKQFASMTAAEWQKAEDRAKDGDYAGAALYALNAHPITGAGRTLIGMGRAQWDQIKKAREAFRKSQEAPDQAELFKLLTEGSGYALAGLLPIVGPMGAHAAETAASGDVDRAIGQVAGLATPFAVKPAYAAIGGRLQGARLPNLRNPNAVEAAAVDAALNAGVKVDAATATGNPAVRGMQWGLERTVGGSGVGRIERAKQAQSMTMRADELANQVDPYPSTPETAGADVRRSVKQLTKDFGTQASESYQLARQIEARPELAERVLTAPEGSPTYQRLVKKLEDGLKADGVETRAGSIGRDDIVVMRQIEAELDMNPYQRGKLVTVDPNNPYYAKGSGNADVYHDIQQAAGTSSLTGAEMVAGIQKTLETGEWNAASRAAFQVAQDRLRKSGTLTGPTLPKDAPLLGKVETVQLPVHLKSVRRALRPLYVQLRREARLAPLMGGKADALRALDRLMTGPEAVPASIADKALSNLKAMARTDIPELRTQGQGLASVAVRELSEAIDAAMRKAGPDAVDALDTGRAMTRAKYETGDLLKQLRDEPVGVYRQATQPKDAGITLLRDIRDKAPQDIPKVGRAVLEDLLSTATAEGGFDRGAGLFAKWQQLGPETKRILFGASLRADLDQFFLLAKKAAENPNASGTGFQVALGAQGAWVFTDPIGAATFQISAAALTKLLHNQRFVRALIKERRIDLPDVGARHAALLQIAQIAGKDAVYSSKAAERREETPVPTGRR